MVNTEKRYAIAEPAASNVCEVGDDLCSQEETEHVEDNIDQMLKTISTPEGRMRMESERKGIKISTHANAAGKAPDADMSVCSDRHDGCAGFAAHGECAKNPGWMIVNCALSCDACELRDPAVRCSRERLNISTTPIYAPGRQPLLVHSP